MSVKLLEINATNFKSEILESETPSVVDFWAPWCAPCKMLAPIVDELAALYKEKVKFAKINVDDNPELATDLEILSIPVLIFFKDGKELKRIVGVNTKGYLQEEIDKALT